MSTGNLASELAILFQGRMDAYGTDEGGCEWVPDHVDPGPLWLSKVERHLDGTRPMGVYPYMDDGTCLWGCTDLDNGEADLGNALNIATMLRAAGLNAWVERSRSKGYHVWSFASEPVPVEVMRNAFLAVHQRLEVPAKEVNPKQIKPTPKNVGNYVRLPYPGADGNTDHGDAGVTANGRQMVLDPEYQVPMSLSLFVADALQSRSPLAAYEAVAARYVPPPPPKPVEIDTESAADLDELREYMSKDTWLAFKYGPRDGHDRSDSLARLVHMCQEDGLTAGEALRVLADADRRWGKHHDRGDADVYLPRLIERIYGR